MKQLKLAIVAAVSVAFSSVNAHDVDAGTESAPLPAADSGEKRFAISPELRPLPPGESEYIDVKGDPEASLESNAANEVSAVERRFRYAFRLSIRGVYDDNIFLTPSNQVDDFYFAFEPGITLGFGDIGGSEQNYLLLDYAPSAFFYADHPDANAVQHLIRLQGQYHFGRLTLTFSQDVQLLEGANLAAGSTDPNPVAPVNLDAGGDIKINIYTTRANFTYDLTGKTFLSGGVQYTVNDFAGSLISSATLPGNLFINYTFSPKLVIGLGGIAGYNWVDSPSPDQTFEQINGRVTYQVTGKITVNASGGVEFRQFAGDARNGSYVSPVYEVGATYQPFDGTGLSLRGNRRTQNSAVAAGQNYASTNVTVAARQRFLQRIYLGLAVGFENSSYFSTVDGVDASREDNYFFVQLAIDVTLTRFWTVGAYYLHRENDSSTNSFGFHDNQLGMRTSLTF